MSTSIQGQIDTERSGCKQIAIGTYIIVPSENHTLSKSEELFFKINEKLNTNLISALRRNQKNIYNEEGLLFTHFFFRNSPCIMRSKRKNNRGLH